LQWQRQNTGYDRYDRGKILIDKHLGISMALRIPHALGYFLAVALNFGIAEPELSASVLVQQ